MRGSGGVAPRASSAIIRGESEPGRRLARKKILMAKRYAVAVSKPEQQALRADDASDEEHELPQMGFDKIYAWRELCEGPEEGDQVVAVIQAESHNNSELHEPEPFGFHGIPLQLFRLRLLSGVSYERGKLS